MKKLIRRVLALGVLLVILVIAGVVLLIVNVNSIARKGIEAGGTYALGVPTTVKGVDIGLFSGEASLSGLNVANPQGFTGSHFLALGDGTVAVSLGTLQKDVVEIPTFALSGIDVKLQRTGDGSNYSVILDNLKKVSGGSDPGAKPEPAPSPAPSGSEKKFIVRNLTIKNVSVELDMLGAGGDVGKVLNDATKFKATIPEIQLKDVGQTGSGVGGSGVTIGQLSSIIVQAVLSAAADKGGFPADIVSDLQGRIANLGDLKDLGMSIGGQAKEALEKAGGAVKEKVEEGKKALEDAKKGLEGLLPGGK
ncbi:MAG: hypothetical protein AB7K52_03740 [Phycisphaerales bacterium]